MLCGVPSALAKVYNRLWPALDMVDRAGILTGGGDAPGLNGVIRAVTFGLTGADWEVIGFHNGWKGVLEKAHRSLDRQNTRDLISRGGTILGTSRFNPYRGSDHSIPGLKETFHDLDLKALIVLGGDDTLGVAARLWEEDGLPVIGVPKTVDNDIPETRVTFGFDTAVNIATEALDRLWTTANSHERVIVVELAGRNTGHIALHAGLAAGVDAILVPEEPVDLDGLCRRLLDSRQDNIRRGNLVVVAVGTMLESDTCTLRNSRTDEFDNPNLGGVGRIVAQKIHERTGLQTRCIIPGQMIRGGTPTANDRILATRYGLFAARMALLGEHRKMAALQRDTMVAIDLGKAAGRQRVVGPARLEMARTFYV